MGTLELSAHMKVRPGQLEGFKRQAAEIIRRTQEKDTQTLRYDWFLSKDGAECEVRESYRSADGLIEHRKNVGDAIDKLFAEFADDHHMTIYGEPSPKLVELAKAHGMMEHITWFSSFGGMKPRGTT